VVRRAHGDEALCSPVSPVMLYVVSGHQPALGVSDHVKAIQPIPRTDALDLVGDQCREIRDGAGIETPEQAAQIETEDAVAVVTKAVLKDLPDIPCLEEAVQEEHGLWGLGKVALSNDTVSSQVHPANAAELVAQVAVDTRWSNGTH